MWLTLLALIPESSAHPSGATNASDPNGGMPGQRIEVQVEPGHLRVDYYVEIAAIRLYKEARAEGAAGSEWAPKHAESLRPGVRARWNDAELQLTPLPMEKPAQLKEASYVELHLAGETALPGSAGTLQLRMDNYPDEPCYYAASVWLDGDLVVTETDLGHVTDGRLRDNRHGAWRRDNAGRVAQLTVRPTHAWEGAVAGPLPERMEGIVKMDWFAIGGVGALGIVTAALGGLAWRRRTRR